MGDNQSLLLILGVLYLVECLVWIPRGTVVLTSWLSRRFQLRHPGALLGNGRGSWHLAAPLPPLGTVLFCQQFPVSISPHALYAYSALCLEPGDRLRHSGQWWPWDKIETISTRNRTVQINGTAFCQTSSTGTARFLSNWLRKIRSATPGDRPRLIRQWIQAMLAKDTIRARWQAFQAHNRTLRFLTNLAFVYLFIAVPCLLWRHGWVHVGWWLLGGMLAQTTTIALLFHRAHRALFPQAGEERFKRVLTMLLAPPAALRAAELLGRPLLEHFHMLAVAGLLLPPERFAALGRQFLIDLHYPMLPICPSPNPERVATEQWFRNTLLASTEQFLQEAGLQPENVLSPPLPGEPANRSYCPRCNTQFLREGGTCLDCGGRSLWPLSGRQLAVEPQSAIP